MKAQAVNTFTGGLVKDLHPLTTPKDVLTDALNATLITYDGNEYILQNDMGNGRVETARLPSGFVPLGVREYGGIIYVVSHNPLTGESQIGSFPSPERQISTTEMQTNLSLSGILSTSNAYLRLDIGGEDFKLSPGDKFIIGGNLSSYISAISQYNSSSNKLFKIHIGIVDRENNIVYIEQNLKKYNGSYWIYNGDITTLTDYQSFTEKTSGYLTIIVEMEVIDTFEVSRNFTYTAGRDNADDSRFGLTLQGASTTSSQVNTSQYKVEFVLNGNSTTSYSNTGLTFSMSDFTKNDILTYKATPFLKWGSVGLGYADAFAVSGGVSFSMLGTGYCNLLEWRYYVDDDYVKVSWGLDIDPLREEIVESVKFHFFSFYEERAHQVLVPEGNSFKSLDYFKCNARDNYNGNFVENIPFHKSTEQGYSLNKGDLYYVVIEVKFKNKDTGEVKDSVFFRKFLYTTTLFNEYYLDISKTDFSTIFLEGVVKSKAELVNSSIEATPVNNDISVGDLFTTENNNYYNYLKSIFSTKVGVKYSATLDDENKYFGKLNTDLYKQVVTNDNIERTVDNTKNRTYLGSNLNLAESLEAKITENGESLGAWLDPMLLEPSEDEWTFNITSNGYVKRGIYATPSETSLQYKRLVLEKFYDTDPLKIDTSKLGAEIAMISDGVSDRPRITGGPCFTGRNGFGYIKFVPQEAGTEEPVDILNSGQSYTGFKYALNNTYAQKPCVAIITANPKVDSKEPERFMSCIYTSRKLNTTSDGASSTTAWQGDYDQPNLPNGVRCLSMDYMLVCWKTTTDGWYQVLNFGGVRRIGWWPTESFGDSVNISGLNNVYKDGRTYEWPINDYYLYEYVSQLLSKFYLPQYRSKSFSGYVPDPNNIIYHGSYNSVFNMVIKSVLKTAIADSNSILKYTNSDGEEKFLNTNTASSLINEFNATLGSPTFKNDLIYNNIKFNSNSDGLNLPEYIDTTGDITVTFETGRNISLDNMYASYINTVTSTREVDSTTVYLSADSTETKINGVSIDPNTIYISNNGSTSGLVPITTNPTVTIGNYSLPIQSKWFKLSPRVDQDDIEILSNVGNTVNITMSIAGGDRNTGIPLNTDIKFSSINMNCPWSYTLNN